MVNRLLKLPGTPWLQKTIFIVLMIGAAGAVTVVVWDLASQIQSLVQ